MTQPAKVTYAKGIPAHACAPSYAADLNVRVQSGQRNGGVAFGSPAHASEERLEGRSSHSRVVASIDTACWLGILDVRGGAWFCTRLMVFKHGPR